MTATEVAGEAEATGEVEVHQTLVISRRVGFNRPFRSSGLEVQVEVEISAKSEVVLETENSAVFLVEFLDLEPVISMTGNAETKVRDHSVDSVVSVVLA